VDDNPVNIKIEQAILGKSGYRTVSASSGRECIRTLMEFDPDLILLDICMPEMNGIEVCKTLKKEKHLMDIPVIFITASTDNEILKEAFESGATDYVRTPINRVELLTRIKSALTERKLVESYIGEERLKGILEMAGAVCHEINQPMQAISGYSEILLMGISTDNPLYKNVKKIKDQVVRMGTIARKLAGITRYETKSYVGDLRIIDIEKASEMVTTGRI
jgi:CheY-like chemotaxis protein